MKKLIVIVSLCFATSVVSASSLKLKQAGVDVGSQVPEISATDIDGNSKTIKQLSGEKGLVLVFFRSADWCPYCKRQLVEVNQWDSKIKTLGYKIAAVSYDSTTTLRKFSEKRHLTYPLLADQNHKTMEDMKVINDEQKPGTEHYGIPFPGIMVIDANGKLIYKYFYQGYKHRVKMKDLYQQLKL